MLKTTRRAFTFLCLASLTPTYIHADTRVLKGQDIIVLLSENTALGFWFDAPYRQFFYADGTTLYAVENQRTARGLWRVHDGFFQSLWPGGEWETYHIEQIDNQYFWIGPDGTRQPFAMQSGQHLIWP